MGKKPLLEVPRIAAHRFHYDSHVLYKGIPFICSPARDEIFHLTVDKDFLLVGWCECSKLDGNLGQGHQEEIAIMCWHRELEYVWQHYPLYEECYERAMFVFNDNIVD